MPARKYQDLKAWQHADRLRAEVLAVTPSLPFPAIEESAISCAARPNRRVPTLLRASGDTARGSLRISQELREAHWTKCRRLTLIASEGAATCTGLMRYLKTQAAQENAGGRKKTP